MATKTEADGQHPSSHYLVVEDAAKPSTWHLRVRDASGKPDHRLMGAAWAALHTGYRGNTYDGPNKADALKKLIALYKSEGLPTPASMAAFAVELAATGEAQGRYVVRRGKLFQAGDYPDKQFSMSAAELAAAVASFRPVPLDSEHRESVFDGQLGEVEAIEVCEGGQSLCGAVRIPDWLDALFPNIAIPVSTTWDRETKTLMGLALAKHPRVSDAAILAAFARHDTWEGRGTLQGIHDMAARAGATCQPPADRAAGMNSAHENDAMQQIHDMASGHGARCSAMGDRYASYVDSFAAFAGRRHSGNDQAALNAAHDAIVQAGAECAGAKAGMKETRRMQLFSKDWWAALFAAQAEADAPQPTAPSVVGESAVTRLINPATTTAITTDPALSARLKELETQLADQRRERIEGQAAGFADGAVRACRALPAERQALYDAYVQAAADDAAHGVVTLSEGTTQSRVTQLEALIAARPQHALTAEQVATNAAGTLPNDARAAQMSEERHDTLLAMTPLGQAALDRKRAARGGAN